MRLYKTRSKLSLDTVFPGNWTKIFSEALVIVAICIITFIHSGGTIWIIWTYLLGITSPEPLAKRVHGMSNNSDCHNLSQLLQTKNLHKKTTSGPVQPDIERSQWGHWEIMRAQFQPAELLGNASHRARKWTCTATQQWEFWIHRFTDVDCHS